jgi:uncharacterized membrane protein YqjE
MIEEQLRRPVAPPPDFEYADRPPPSNGPSLGQLFSDLSTDFSELVREEIRLARVETMEKVSTVTRSVVSMVAGGLIAYAGLLFLLAMVAILLANVVPFWLATAIVGIVAIVIGAIMIMGGRSALSNMTIVPEKRLKLSRTTQSG